MRWAGSLCAQIGIFAALIGMIATGRRATATPVAALPARPSVLRVCADPNNLPFSNQAGEGIDNAMARLVAATLGARVEYTWLPQRRGFVRNTLKAGKCDVMMEVPVGYGRVDTTVPYYRSTYVFVSRSDHGLQGLRSFDDPRLRALRVGVQVIGDDYANSPPAAALGSRGLAARVVGFPVYGDYGTPAPLAPIIDAVVAGAVDVAVVWGPLAGWYARRSATALSIVPVASAVAEDKARIDPPLAFDMAMGTRRGDDALKQRLDTVIETHRRQIGDILRRFGVPQISTSMSASQPPRGAR